MDYLFSGVSLQNKRQSNMDGLIMKQRQICKESALLLAICDGVGSLVYGAYASIMAIEMLGEWFDSARKIDRIGIDMRDAILRINKQIVARAKQEDISVASTLSTLLLVGKKYYIVHIGDSRIYCCENAKLSILTRDDISLSGKLTDYIGKNDTMFPQYSEGVATGKTFLICSDGLYKRMDMEFLKKNMKSWNQRVVDKTANILSEFVVAQGEQDNISLILAKILK